MLAYARQHGLEMEVPEESRELFDGKAVVNFARDIEERHLADTELALLLTHVATILGKMGVANRRQAARRARELDLLPKSGEAPPHT